MPWYTFVLIPFAVIGFTLGSMILFSILKDVLEDYEERWRVKQLQERERAHSFEFKVEQYHKVHGYDDE